MNHSKSDPVTRTGSKLSESGMFDGEKAQLVMSDQARNDSTICEAANCFAKATIRIDVNVGVRRTISLSLCNKCVSKFEDESSTIFQSRKGGNRNQKVIDTMENMHHFCEVAR
jgi:hypothetical protein